MSLTRLTRYLRIVGVGVSLIVVAVACGPSSVSDARIPVTFKTPLAIPPLNDGVLDASGSRVFDLAARESTKAFVPGKPTRTWGYNAAYLGSTLRAHRGDHVKVRFRNDLPEATTVHWHGMHLPARADGGPHQPVQPGRTWQPEWTINQPAATLWYHPHPGGQTEQQVYNGLAGLFLIDDDQEASLPHRYGVDDIPLIVQDKQLSADGGMTLGGDGPIGALGKTMLVNGTIGPYQEVRTERVRLRLLNASTARIYDFGFADNRRFQVVASDGGRLARPVSTTRVQLSPAERAEVVVEMTPGTTAMLKSYPPDLDSSLPPSSIGADTTFDVLQLRATADLAPSPEVPAHLEDLADATAQTAVKTRTFELGGREINGRHMDMGRVDTVVEEGTSEIWEVRTMDPFPHSFHVHDQQFRIVSVDGHAPAPELAGRKDTVLLSPRHTYRLLLSFRDYADPTAPYMYHCHLLQHEDQGMMGQFVVVPPGHAMPVSGAGHAHE